ncbi:hypothetical protein PG995_014482 [Apiospora arundinis]
MDIAAATNRAVAQIPGLNFGRGRGLKKPKLIFSALVLNSADNVTLAMSQGEIAAALETRLNAMVSHAVRANSVYTDSYREPTSRCFHPSSRRLRILYLHLYGDECPCPLSAEDIESVFLSLEDARKRALATIQGGRTSSPKSQLTTALDIMLSLREKAGGQRPDDSMITLKPGKSSRPSMLSGPSNNGIRVNSATHDVHTALYGITPQTQGSIPNFPTDQDNPVTVRRFLGLLGYEALTKSNAGSPWSLYCAPVAFLDDIAREAWYTTTGHKSRFYSTIAEFVDYAKEALRRGNIERAIFMLTPWFYNANEVPGLARDGNLALPTAWEKKCFRSGMTLIIAKDGKMDDNRTKQFQVVVFQPQAPLYPRAAPRSAGRGDKQDAWVSQVFEAINGKMHHIAGTWVGGTLKDSSSSNAAASRGVNPDSVELSAALISELTEDPQSLTTDPMSLSARKFRQPDVRQSAWN